MTLSESPGLRLQSAAVSDVGRRRVNNEDAYIADVGLGLYAVADGMGGEQGGEVAAQMAIDILLAAVHSVPDGPYLRDPSLANRRTLLDWLARTVSDINAAIFQGGQENPALRGMGTTLDVVLVRGNGLFFAHVGDSRIYLLRGGELQQLTEDHTLFRMLLASGRVSTEQAARHPQRERLTRAVGPTVSLRVDTGFTELSVGDKIVLCSDGLYRMVEPAEMQAELMAPAEHAAPALIRAALDGGGVDNVTAVVAHVEASSFAQPVLIGSEAARSALARSSLFEAFTAGELVRVQKIAAGGELQPGETLLVENEPCDGFFIVVSGGLTVWREGQKIGFLEPGDPAGELAMVKSTADATFRAEVPTRYLHFPLADVRELMDSDLIISMKLASAAAVRLSQRVRRLAELVGRYRSTFGDLPG